MRERIFEIIEVGKDNDKVSKIYDFFMMFIIVVSIVPLAIKEDYLFCEIIDKVTVAIFVLDYILRWITTDYKTQKGWKSFLLYPISLMALIDMVSILPSLIVINQSFKLLKGFRLIRTLRVFRVMKGFRYSKNINILVNVFKEQKASLTVVGTMAVGYIFVTALVMFNVEPDTFENFFQAMYWATVSLTTVGYGDIYATTITGQIVTMVSSFVGIAIVALPAGIITAGYMNELNKE